MRFITICFLVAVFVAFASAQRFYPRPPIRPRCRVVSCPRTFAPTPICAFRFDRANNDYIYKDFSSNCELKNWNCENRRELYTAFTAEGDSCIDIGKDLSGGLSEIKSEDIAADNAEAAADDAENEADDE